MNTRTLAWPIMARISAETGMALRAAKQDHLMYQIPVSMMWSFATRFWPGRPSSPRARRPLPFPLRRSLVRNIGNKPRHGHRRQQGSSNSCQCFRAPKGASFSRDSIIPSGVRRPHHPAMNDPSSSISAPIRFQVWPPPCLRLGLGAEGTSHSRHLTRLSPDDAVLVATGTRSRPSAVAPKHWASHTAGGGAS